MSSFCNLELYHYSLRILIYCIILLLIESLFRKNITSLYYINLCLKSLFSCQFESRLVLKPIVFIFSCSNNGIFADFQNIRKNESFFTARYYNTFPQVNCMLLLIRVRADEINRQSLSRATVIHLIITKRKFSRFL